MGKYWIQAGIVSKDFFKKWGPLLGSAYSAYSADNDHTIRNLRWSNARNFPMLRSWIPSCQGIFDKNGL